MVKFYWQLAHTLSNFNWSPMYMMQECHCMLHYFYCTVCDINFFLPVRISRISHFEKPWVNDRFRQITRQRQHAWMMEDMPKYRALGNLAQRTAKKTNITVVASEV